MRTLQTRPGFSLKIVVLALLAAFGSAHAADDEIAALIRPDSSVSIGAAGVTGAENERSIFGQYNGLRRQDAYLLLDLDVIKRDDATGTWTTLQGRNLGLDTREIRFGQQKQGDWKYSFEYDEMIRRDPRTINTSLVGAGSTAPVVSRLATAGGGSDVNLDLKRKNTTIALEKWLSPSLQFEASFRNEDKNGARMFGNGMACPSGSAPSPLCTTGVTQWAQLMLPEPINSSTQQFDAKLNYASDKLMLSGGYYGSFYSNQYQSMAASINGELSNPLGNQMGLPGNGPALGAGLRGMLQNPIALPPDSQAHQFYLTGNYAFTPTTKANFKYAYTHAAQTDNFSVFGGAPGGRSDLGAKVDTSLYQLGLTSRPISKLSLLANVRYEDRNDKTPIAYYNVEGNPATTAFTNGNYSPKRLNGKLEGTYQLPDGYRATLGFNYESLDRGTFVSTNSVAGLSGLRQKSEETGYRMELRRSMIETLTGAIGYSSSHRSGSSWLKPLSLSCTGLGGLSDAGRGVIVGDPSLTSVTACATFNNGIYGVNSIFPSSMTDRQRDKIKMSADWAATDQLSLQFMAEWGQDNFSSPGTKGLRSSYMGFYGVDAAYALSENWKLTGYWSRGDQTMHVDHSTGYLAALRNLSDSYGFGVIGKPTSRLQVGGDLLLIDDRDEYKQRGGSTANSTLLSRLGGLPDVTFQQFTLKLFGRYALDKTSAVRMDLIHQQTKLNEWTWGYNGTPFVYSDNSTVTLRPSQSVNYLGATYIVALP